MKNVFCNLVIINYFRWELYRNWSYLCTTCAQTCGWSWPKIRCWNKAREKTILNQNKLRKELLSLVLTEVFYYYYPHIIFYSVLYSSSVRPNSLLSWSPSWIGPEKLAHLRLVCRECCYLSLLFISVETFVRIFLCLFLIMRDGSYS